MNAKSEFLDFLKNYLTTPVRCAIIVPFGKGELESLLLNEGYKEDDYKKFLDSLDFEYDNDVNEELNGNIWFEDGTWAERFTNYECRDIWILKSYPYIPEALRKTRTNKIIDLLDSKDEIN